MNSKLIVCDQSSWWNLEDTITFVCGHTKHPDNLFDSSFSEHKCSSSVYSEYSSFSKMSIVTYQLWYFRITYWLQFTRIGYLSHRFKILAKGIFQRCNVPENISSIVNQIMNSVSNMNAQSNWIVHTFIWNVLMCLPLIHQPFRDIHVYCSYHCPINYERFLFSFNLLFSCKTTSSRASHNIVNII